MKENLTEARDIVADIISDVEGRYPVGLVRVHFLLEQVLGEMWDKDDVAVLACEPTTERPFPAA